MEYLDRDFTRNPGNCFIAVRARAMERAATMIIFDNQQLPPDQSAILGAIYEYHFHHTPMADLHVVVSKCLKVKYGHKETAETAADAMKRLTGCRYDVIECAVCDGWHIEHSRFAC